VRAVADFNMQILSCIAVKAEQIVYNTGVKFNLCTAPDIDQLKQLRMLWKIMKTHYVLIKGICGMKMRAKYTHQQVQSAPLGFL
jgi:hypothetical protein